MRQCAQTVHSQLIFGSRQQRRCQHKRPLREKRFQRLGVGYGIM
jgi:hypothetical protein